MLPRISLLLVLIILIGGCVTEYGSEYSIEERITEDTEKKEAGICGLFNYPPAELEKVEFILPMGGVSGDHVAPIDHIYLRSDQNVEVYSPDDGNIYSMQHMGSFTGDNENMEPFDDYRLVINHDCYESTFIHLDELSPKLAAVAPEFGKYKSVSVQVGAGELLGSYTGSLDYLIVDGSRSNNLSNPDSYSSFPEKLHIFDPFDYFSDEIRDQMRDLSLRTEEPVGGYIDYDKDGTLLGTWFKEGTNGWAGLNPERYWDKPDMVHCR